MRPPKVDDFDTSIVRIEEDQMKKLGINKGDTVKITGTKDTGAICYTVEDGFRLHNDSDIIYASKAESLPQLRASNFVLDNVTSHGGTGLLPVSLEKVHDGTIGATKVSLMPLSSSPNTDGFDKTKLEYLIACKSNRFRFRDSDPRNNFGFLITNVEPSDYCQINKDTTIEFVPIESDVIYTSFGVAKLEKLENVIPIVYEESLENVTVTIPSLEIYNNGIKFRVHIDGIIDNKNMFRNGSTSIVATLHDDAENMCPLTQHSGGGSSSQTHFEYNYEFYGKPLNPNARQLTITIKEILIQEQFPRVDPHRPPKMQRVMKETKENYEKIEKFPSFFIITGPWKTTFSIKQT